MILGVDPGERRIGVAAADPETRFARPVEVIDAAAVDPVARVIELARELDADKIVVGRPVGLSGKAGPAVEVQARFVEALRGSTDLIVDEYDERLTTVVAERALRAGGTSARGRKEMRDAVAAQVMLQDYLDSGR